MTKVIDTTQVTQDQIDMCYRAFEIATRRPFYVVKSETKANDEYEVKAKEVNGEYKYTCTCPSGRYGFWNVKNQSGYCKHVRWAVAAGKQYKANLKAQEQAKQPEPKIIDSIPSWILTARPAPHMRRSPAELGR